MPDVDAATTFVWTHARVLDRHRFAHRFLGAPAEPVLAALAAYATGDGGYGHALEPDLRGPDAQIGAMETALSVLAEVDALDGPEGRAAIGWLERIAPDGGVPFMLPSGLRFPRAPWWQTDPDPPGSLVATGFVAGALLGGGVRHPWLDRAAEWCWREIEAAESLAPYGARGALAFLDATPDAERAQRALARLAPLVDAVVTRDLDGSGEHHGPLDLSPRPDGRSRALFPAELVAAQLDHLAAAQQDDGGWPWRAADWSPAATAEWRGIVTLEALTTLRDHGRLDAS